MKKSGSGLSSALARLTDIGGKAVLLTLVFLAACLAHDAFRALPHDGGRSSVQDAANPGRAPLSEAARERVRKIVADCATRDQRAAEDALGEIHRLIDGYRERIPDFVDNVFSLKSKAVILWKSAGDGIGQLRGRDDCDSARNYIREIWDDTMFSEKELSDRVAQEMASLRYCLAENRHQMASELLAEFGTMSDGTMDVAADANQIEAMCDVLDREIVRIAEQSSGQAIRGEGAALLLDAALTPVITKTVLALFRPVGTAAASGAAGTGGATAAGFASGAWTFGVGIVVGVVIDIGINHYAKKQTTEKLHGFLDSIEQDLIEGDEDTDGLRPILRASLDAYHQSLEAATLETVRVFATGS